MDTVLAIFIGVVLAAVIGYLLWQGVKSRTFHRNVSTEPVILSTPVVVRHHQATPWKTWSRPYGDSVGSNPMTLVIRPNSIEVSYTGRPAGGIGGLQWFLDARRTTMEPLSPEDSESLTQRRGVLLVESDEHGKSGTKLAIDVDARYDEVWNALLTASVRQGGLQ